MQLGSMKFRSDGQDLYQHDLIFVCEKDTAMSMIQCRDQGCHMFTCETIKSLVTLINI